MKAASFHSGALSFVPVDQWQGGTWARPTDMSFLDTGSSIPIAATELLQVAQLYPLAVRQGAGTFWVEAVTERRLLRVPAVDETGRLTRPYAPIAIRCLPFRLSPAQNGGRKTGLEVAAGFGGGETDTSLRGTDGMLSVDVRRVEKLLANAAESQAQLTTAVELLFLADLLVPLSLRMTDGAEHDERPLLTLDRAALAGSSREKLAIIASGGLLVIDLIASLVRSSDHFHPDAVTVQREVWKGSLDNPVLSDLDSLIRKVGRMEFELDASELFSFDRLDAEEAPLASR